MKKLVSFQALGLDPVPWSVPEICVTKAGRRFSRRAKKSNLVLGKASLEDWQLHVKQAAQDAMAGISKPRGPLRIDMVFHATPPLESARGTAWVVPLKWNEESQEYTKTQPRGKPEPDLVNLIKGTEDALQGVVFEDDVQTRSITAEMVYGVAPGVYVTVYTLEH
jgi:Holliday junction resolvase RusA-like endonuclease